MATKDETTPVATRLPPDLLAKLDVIATASGENRSEALRRVLKEHEAFPAIDPDSAFFLPPLPAPPGPAVDFQETRYDHVIKRGRR